jgi:uncharacterized protein YgiM (DUF1202 family)
VGKTTGDESMSVVKIGVVGVLCWLMLTNAMAAESGVALKEDSIRSEPFGDAKMVAKLSVNDKVTILGKEGGWLQVSGAKGKGWVRMLSIRKGDAKKGANEAAGLLSMSSGRAGTGNIVATSGIRGLNEEELKAAKFNVEEVNLAESYATSKVQAQQFANEGKLVARKFDYLPEVK